MVLKKRLNYGFNTFNFSDVPRAPRSIRKRVHAKRSFEDGQICAFELLASLAGKLLKEKDSTASSNVSEGDDHASIGKDSIKREIQCDNKPLRIESVERGSSDVSVVVSESTTEKSNSLKEFVHAEKVTILEHNPLKTQLAFLEQNAGDLKSVICKDSVAYGNCTGNLGSSNLEKGCDSKSENEFKQELDTKSSESGPLNISNSCPSKHPVEFSKTFPPSINYDRDSKLPSHEKHVPNAPLSRLRNHINVGSRDDDEKFSRFNKLSNRFKAGRPPARIRDRRIRRLLTSKHWKVSPKLKDSEHYRADGGAKPLYPKRKTFYNYEWSEYDPFRKRRKLFDRSSIATSDGGISSESVSNLPEKVIDGEKRSSGLLSQGVCGVSSLPKGHQRSRQSKDSRVKFSIKSFGIPELYIEVPETATVGSLKLRVMEAVNALLGGGIRVGVLLQGKKVRDDRRTLSQTGISCENSLDDLGFTLESGPLNNAPPPVCSEELPLLLSRDAASQNITSSPITPTIDTDTRLYDTTPDPLPLTNSANDVDNNHEPASMQTDMLTDQILPESRALVPVPAINVEALAVIGINQKSRKSELARRRTRRPFSVSEVEALVQAVEELGTGRWRDVKLQAFENADHRTYVDLKDKWKTLVHTAKISPQQRRGEPVPQELLDRVLAAHAYWSQPHVKHQGKDHSGTLTLTDTSQDAEIEAVAIPMATM